MEMVDASEPLDENQCNTCVAKLLADRIKATHESLRESLLTEGKSFRDVWDEHLAAEEERRLYADSMFSLATKFWQPDDSSEPCRVTWCHEFLKQYFARSVNQYIEKDLRVACCQIDLAETKCLGESPDGGADPLESMPDKLKRTEIQTVREKFRDNSEVHQVDFKSLTEQGAALLFGSELSKPGFASAKRLLDVGSCYDPFSKLGDPNLEVYPIDLTPACKTVYQVDFVKVPTSKSCDCFSVAAIGNYLVSVKEKPPEKEAQQGEDNNANPTNEESCPSVNVCYQRVKCLPENFFDVVTFCLVLSYIPSAAERLNFCRKARKLLKFNGLLLITETQSVTPHNNWMLMKQWQVEIECLGFRRIKYESKTHIHAMAFRKIPRWLRRCSFEGDDVPKTKANKKPLYRPVGLLPINQDTQRSTKAINSEAAEMPLPPHKKRMKIDDT